MVRAHAMAFAMAAVAAAATACGGSTDQGSPTTHGTPTTGSATQTAVEGRSVIVPGESAVAATPTPASAPTAPGGVRPSATPVGTRSGVEGFMLAGPQCPVQSPTNPCPDKPLVATAVFRKSGSVVARVTSAGDGSFQLDLPPGDYVVEADNSGKPPFLKPQTVAVEAGKFTHLVLLFDTGIR